MAKQLLPCEGLKALPTPVAFTAMVLAGLRCGQGHVRKASE